MFKVSEEEKTAWLYRNTFRCRLGRVSLEQCRRNRARPDVMDPEAHLWTGEDLELPDVYRPSQCEECTDWERPSMGIEAGAVLDPPGGDPGGGTRE